MPEPTPPRTTPKTARNVILVTTAMLSFISFWRASAIVLCDLASTAYYIGGIAEQAIGKAAPWFILGVMLFSYTVRALYIESCSMFVRGGVYRVVKEAMGGTLAKLSVSALMFDYVLTGPISAVSAGQYLVGLVNAVLPRVHIYWHLPPNLFAVLFAIAVTLYFWWQNVQGIEESSDKAIKIMAVTTIMAVVMIAWSGLTLWQRGFQWPPIQPNFSPEAWGWLHGWRDYIPPLGFLGLTIAFGHTLLAMSGEESLAQVYREMEAPKLKNLEKTGFIIFLYSLLLTSLVSFFAVMIIPDSVRLSKYSDNLISGLTMYLVGPAGAKLLFQAFVVLVGCLILSGAVNTAIVGSNGVLNRVGEDGVLPDWLRKPHPRFGTTYRLLNLTVGLQLLAILLCRGNIYVLGEAYAFGVIWSFVFNALSVLVLRYKNKAPREWEVPLNFHLGGVEIPVGLAAIFAVLFITACVNLVTKRVATISGSLFTLAFFIVFEVSERMNAKRQGQKTHGLTEDGHIDKVNLDRVEVLTPKDCACTKPYRVVVAVRDPNNVTHLKRVLEEIDPDRTDVLVMSSKIAKGFHLEGSLPESTAEEEILFTQIIAVAEKVGHTVIPLLVSSNDPFYAMARVAYDLNAQELVVGKSGKYPPDIQMEHIAVAWGAVRPPQGRPLRIRIIWDGSEYKEDLV
ncbi:MAG: APC family permease [Elusimicrobia bacterium]|nr:APC family permease [Elusimicrobiota bacterium]